MKRAYFAPIAAFFLISGCGGGGGGGTTAVSPDATLAITSNNAMQVGKIAYEAALQSQTLGDASGGLFFGSAPGTVTKTDTNLAIFGKSINAGNSASLVPIPAETVPCTVSGTQTVSGDIADIITPTLTAGDFFQIEYSACDDGFGDITSGTVRIDIDAFSGDFVGELMSMTITLTLTNFQVSILDNQSTIPTDVLTSNGGATLTIDTRNSPAVSTSISGISLVVDTNSSSESLTNFASAFTMDGNILPSPYTTTASGTLDSTELAGVIRYSNPVIFAGVGSEFPSSGEFLIDGLNSNLRLIAENNVDVRIEIDLGADGTVDETINTTWTELTAAQVPGQ